MAALREATIQLQSPVPIKLPLGKILRSVSSWVVLSLNLTLVKRVLQMGILFEDAMYTPY